MTEQELTKRIFKAYVSEAEAYNMAIDMVDDIVADRIVLKMAGIEEIAESLGYRLRVCSNYKTGIYECIIYKFDNNREKLIERIGIE